MWRSRHVFRPTPRLKSCRTENLGTGRPISRVLCEKWGLSAMAQFDLS
jgi:hypothetical protein